MTAAMRAHINLDAEEAAALEEIRSTSSPYNTALSELAGVQVGPSSSTARVTHALLEIGLRAVQDEAEKIGLARLAAYLVDDNEHQAWRASRRARTLHAGGLG